MVNVISYKYTTNNMMCLIPGLVDDVIEGILKHCTPVTIMNLRMCSKRLYNSIGDPFDYDPINRIAGLLEEYESYPNTFRVRERWRKTTKLHHAQFLIALSQLVMYEIPVPQYELRTHVKVITDYPLGQIKIVGKEIGIGVGKGNHERTYWPGKIQLLIPLLGIDYEVDIVTINYILNKYDEESILRMWKGLRSMLRKELSGFNYQETNEDDIYFRDSYSMFSIKSTPLSRVLMNESH